MSPSESTWTGVAVVGQTHTHTQDFRLDVQKLTLLNQKFCACLSLSVHLDSSSTDEVTHTLYTARRDRTSLTTGVHMAVKMGRL